MVLISEGCQLDRCVIEHCVLGLRLRVGEGAILEDALVMGADAYESQAERAQVRSRGGVPLGIGAGSLVRRAILDKNVRIGAHVQIIKKDRVQEADRSELGFTIRDGIVIERPDGFHSPCSLPPIRQSVAESPPRIRFGSGSARGVRDTLALPGAGDRGRGGGHHLPQSQ